MKNVLLIINPVSGQRKIQSKLFNIVYELCKANCKVTTQITQYRGHATELAKSAKSEGYDTVICCGGDGTLNETLSGILQTKNDERVKLGYVPCGSTNDFADTLGLNSNPIKQIDNIIKENATNLDIGHFNNDKYFSYIASFGAFTSTSYSAPQELKNAFGHFAYIMEGLRDVANIQPIEAKITVDGEELSGKFVFGSVSNTKSVAGIVKLKDDIVDLNDGMFEVLLVKYPENILDLNDILVGASQSDFNSDIFFFKTAKNIEFEFNQPVAWSLDGEKAEAGSKVKIEALHNVVTLYV